MCRNFFQQSFLLAINFVFKISALEASHSVLLPTSNSYLVPANAEHLKLLMKIKQFNQFSSHPLCISFVRRVLQSCEALCAIRSAILSLLTNFVLSLSEGLYVC